MKKLILTILTTITILGINAQGNNLQFNRALFERYDIDCIGNFNNQAFYKSNIFTIPVNKVWKIHRSSIINHTSINSNDLYFGGLVSISLANEDKFFLVCTTSSSSYSEEQNGNIIWLPSGTYDMKVKVPNSGTYDVIFNGIEFNIVQ
jgi:hypothetical protein